MPIVRTYTWGEAKTDLGGEGWLMKGMESFDVLVPERDGTGGMLLAHDMLEHFNATDTSLDAEYLAFGSMLYFRGEPDWWAGRGASGFTDPGVVMSDDVARFIVDAVWQDTHLNTPPAQRKLDDDLEDILSTLRVHALRQIRDMLDETDKRWKAWGMLQDALGWMRVGCRKAARRWQLPIHERIHLFDTVAALKIPDSEFDYDTGDLITELKVHVDWRTPRAWITKKLWRDPYAD